MRRDPVAPERKRPRRIAKKLAKRHGMQRVRGWSVERMSRIMAPILVDDTLSRIFRDDLFPQLVFRREDFRVLEFETQDGKLTGPISVKDY